MIYWQTVKKAATTYCLYALAIILFCITLTLLEVNDVLPKRQKPVTYSPLKSVDVAKLNLSQTTEFVGVVTSENIDGIRVISIVLQAQENDLLMVGDVLHIPIVGFGVVSELRTHQDSVMTQYEALVQVETSELTTGEKVYLYQ